MLVLRFRSRRAQGNRLQPKNLPRRNDVPRVLRDHVRRQKIERSPPIRLVTAARRADIPFAALQSRNRAFHLHRHKLPRTSHHAVVTPRISPRLARRQSLLARPHQKHRLGPLPSLLLVLNNLRLSLLHSLHSLPSVIPTKPTNCHLDQALRTSYNVIPTKHYALHTTSSRPSTTHFIQRHPDQALRTYKLLSPINCPSDKLSSRHIVIPDKLS